METDLDLGYLRDNKLVPVTKRVLTELSDRLRYHLNEGVFTEKLSTGRTWFIERLYRAQNNDSSQGRYLFEDQRPFLFRATELEEPMVDREPPESVLIPFELDNLREEVFLNHFKNYLRQNCKKGEDKSEYGESAKSNVAIITSLFERAWYGTLVAASKLKKHPEMLYIAEDSDLDFYLRDEPQEERVLFSVGDFAGVLGLPVQETVGLFRRAIGSTVDIERDYIRAVQRLEGYNFSRKPGPMTWCHGSAPIKKDGAFGN